MFQLDKILDQTRNDYKVLNRHTYENILIFSCKRFPNKLFTFNFCTMFYYEINCREVNGYVCCYNILKVGFEIPTMFISYTFSIKDRSDFKKGEVVRRQKYFNFEKLFTEEKEKLKAPKHEIKNTRRKARKPHKICIQPYFRV
jgi:hypothetical protein